jgi:nicotinamide-nucleotide amidase
VSSSSDGRTSRRRPRPGRRTGASPRIEALAVGSEVLAGAVREGNLHRLSAGLARAGRGLDAWTILPDRPEVLVPFFREAAGRLEALLVSGGLGPTPDDLTREALAEALGIPLETDPRLAAALEKRYRRAGVPFTDDCRRQASVPRGARVLPNPVGAAPGLIVEREGTHFVLLPGVPAEFRALFDAFVLPYLEETFPVEPGRVLFLRTVGIPESSLLGRLEDLRAGWGEIEVGYYPRPGGVDLRLVAAGNEPLPADLETRVRDELGEAVYGRDDDDLAALVGGLLAERGETLAVAESCTAGLLGGRITETPGSSRYFTGGVQTYDDDLKRRILDVPEEDLRREGAVSEPVARAMAVGVRRLLGTTWGIAVTGVAGPGGGSEAKPVGTVILALAGDGEPDVRRFRFPGDRALVRARSVETALDFLRRRLRGTLGAAPLAEWERS